MQKLLIFLTTLLWSSQLIAQENLHLYLCIGQSNMAGRAEIPAEDIEPLSNVFLLDSLGEWQKARNPLNLHSSIRKKISMQRLSPAFPFAKSLSSYLPDTQIGLVVNAKGGSSISEWMPGTQFFQEAVLRAKQAKSHGQFKGIIWHQGESDASKANTYLDSLNIFVKALRDSLKSPNLAFIAGQVGYSEKRSAINGQLLKIPSSIRRSAVVSAEGLKTTDGSHFDVESTRILGEGYAEKVMHLVYNQWRLDASHEFAQPRFEKVYKKINDYELKLTFFYPPEFNEEKKYPAMIYFFGGGWKGGSISQFIPHAQYFSQRGIITVLADYRVESRQGTSPYEAVNDAKSAIRYLRQNHEELNIDTDHIIAAGGSAGGHLAATTGMIEGLEEEGEEMSISSKPQALVLFNPVYDNGPTGYGFDRVGGEAKYKTISPMHNIRKGAPPAIVFFGSNDPLVPVATAEEFQWKMRLVGSKSKLFIFRGEGHGFFNLSRGESSFWKTILETDKFLVDLGFIKKQ